MFEFGYRLTSKLAKLMLMHVVVLFIWKINFWICVGSTFLSSHKYVTVLVVVGFDGLWVLNRKGIDSFLSYGKVLGLSWTSNE